MTKPWRSRVLPTLGFLILALGILAGTKSQLGNPSLAELNSRDWTESGPLELSPERARFALLYSVVEDRSFQFSVDVARLATPDLGYKDGHFVSLFAPGTSLLMIPGYLLGKYFGAAHLGATLTIGLFALLNAWLIRWLVIRLGGSRRSGYLAAAIFLFATPAYTYSGVIYQHHLSTAMVLGAVALALGRPHLGRLAAMFGLLGFSLILDYPNAFFIFPVLCYAGLQFFRLTRAGHHYRLQFNPGVVFSSLAVLLPLSLYLLINYASYGSVFQLSNTVAHVQALDEQGLPVAGRGADARAVSDVENLGARKRNALNFFKSRHLLNGLYAFSVSPDRGVLIFTPVILLGFWGLIILRRRHAGLAQTMLAIITVNLLLYSMRSDPWGGWAFGSRYLIPGYAILAVLLGLALAHFRRHLLFLLVFLLLGSYSLYVNVSGAVSSTANPPEVEVLSLETLTGKRQRYSFDRNLEFLQTGGSKSYLYQTFLRQYLTPWQYFQLVTGSLVLTMVLSTWALSREGQR